MIKAGYSLVFLLLGTFQANATEVSELGIKIDPKYSPAPHFDLTSKKVLGSCDGHLFTEQAELDGCLRNVSARLPNTTISGESRITTPSLPVSSGH